MNTDLWSLMERQPRDFGMHFYMGWPRGILCEVPAEGHFSSIRADEVTCTRCLGLLPARPRQRDASLDALCLAAFSAGDLGLFDIGALRQHGGQTR